MTLDEIFAVGHFFSQSLQWEVEELQKLLDEGFASLTEVSLPTIPANRLERGLLLRREPQQDRPSIGIFSGRDAHQHLCARAALWLEGLGLDWQDGNCLYYPGGTADVLSCDESIAVEVGYTGAKKVVRALRANVSVLVVPYLGGGPGFFFERRG